MEKDNIFNEFGFKDPPQSYWMASTPGTEYPALKENMEVDVAIVGGGFVGITCAYLLKKEGLKVAVLEADKILQGTTGHTTAKITSQHGLIYDKTKGNMGENIAKQYAEANESAIDKIEEIIKEKNIDCDFERLPAYVYTHEDKYVQQIKDEAETAASLEIKAHYQETIDLPFQVKAAVRFDHQAKFHPRKFLLALAAEIPGDGSHIFQQTRIVDLKEGERCTVLTEDFKRVIAKNVIIASHYPFYDKPGLYFTRIYPEKSYALGVTIKEKFPKGMYITAEEPGRSLRAQPFEAGELIIVSGEHHKTGHSENTNIHYENLINFVKDTFEVTAIPYRWSTQDCMTLDGLPYVGHLTSNTPNVYVATGFCKWGMTNSMASAMIITDLILKGENPWQDAYNPSRFTPKASAKEFFKENADVAREFITGKLAQVPKDLDIPNGEARVVSVEGERMGVYRDEKGKLHFVDTTCTHMRCELKWHAAEKTWDCPCHGSRFTYEGEIVEGPALKSIKVDVQ